MRNLRKRIPIIGIFALAVAFLIGGTFAYFSQTSSVENYLTARNYDSTITEDFTPPEDGVFTPDVMYDKVVGVTNSGDVGMLVRITYTEYWDAVENTVLYLGASVNDGTDDWYNYGDETTDPDTATGTVMSSYVQKLAGDIVNWVYGGDGYYYYLAELAPGESTTSFVDAIMLKELTQTYVTLYDVYYYDGTADAFVTEADLTEAEKDALVGTIDTATDGSYLVSITEDVDQTGPEGLYNLVFTAETVQAVSEAAADWAVSATVGAVDTFLATID